jgi:signal transduction histidine kinase
MPTVDSSASPSVYAKEYNSIVSAKNRTTFKHLSEGLFFLALIIVGAVFVFRSVRRQFKLQQQQQNFMMAVTHELKTPISVARLNLETIQKYTLEPEKQKKFIRTLAGRNFKTQFSNQQYPYRFPARGRRISIIEGRT